MALALQASFAVRVCSFKRSLARARKKDKTLAAIKVYSINNNHRHKDIKLALDAIKRTEKYPINLRLIRNRKNKCHRLSILSIFVIYASVIFELSTS
jgi:hypothetical protein